MNDETVEQLQIKIAFLERAATELSDVVFRQHKEMEEMKATLSAISERLDRVQPDVASLTADEERPPHY
ncbi:MAG: hypothetical protein NVS1B6_12920 [Steroidobacteraceae bacterium]